MTNTISQNIRLRFETETKYYEIETIIDLLDNFILCRSWGGKATNHYGQLKKVFYDISSLNKEIKRLIRLRLKRGYKLT